jgi:hypothetical protein
MMTSTTTTITRRSRSPAFLPRVLLLVALLLLGRLGCVDCSGSGQFTNVSVVSPYPGRFGHFSFAWAGAIWVAGGLIENDVWGSFDFGRSWHQPFSNGAVVNLPGNAVGRRGLAYNDAVYLVSDGIGGHGGFPGGNDFLTYVSRDPALTSWTTLQDGCVGCYGFSVERMAVPFDGVGTLILVNDGSTADVWWQSATGNFQSVTPGGGTMNTWTPWTAPTDGGAVYTALWGVRQFSATATDAEGLVLILTGGLEGGALLNDVWQLSWSSSFDAPLVYQVTASPGWVARDNHIAEMVHDWLFIYGGGSGEVNYDDAWMSVDYGATWTLYDPAATGSARSGDSSVSLGRRLFITGGGGATGPLQDVYVTYW